MPPRVGSCAESLAFFSDLSIGHILLLCPVLWHLKHFLLSSLRGNGQSLVECLSEEQLMHSRAVVVVVGGLFFVAAGALEVVRFVLSLKLVPNLRLNFCCTANISSGPLVCSTAPINSASVFSFGSCCASSSHPPTMCMGNRCCNCRNDSEVARTI